MASRQSAEAHPVWIGSGRHLARIALIGALAALSSGCPLAFEYNGPGAGNAHSSDPSSPSATAPVVLSYSEQGGTSGTVADGSSVVSGSTTTVTLSTPTQNAVIYYSTNGQTPLTNLGSAQKIDGSSGTITIARTTSIQSLDISAVAIGSNMLPSPVVNATVTVSPYPVLSVSVDKPSISEDGGTATFTITSSSPPAGSITVKLQASGNYVAADLTGPIPVPGPFTATLAQSATTVTLPITGVHDPASVDHTVTVTIQADSNTPPAYTVGTPASASVVLKDDGTYTVTYNGNGASSGTVPVGAANYLPGATVTVSGNSGSFAETGYTFAGWNTQADGNGTTYSQSQTFTMPSSNVILYAKWKPNALVLATFAWVGTGQRPEGMTFDGTWLWVGDANDSKVYKINPSNGSAVASFALGAPGATHALAIDASGEFWTTTFWTDPPVLYRWPAGFAAFDKSLPLAATMDFPTAMAFDSTNNVIWVVNTNSPSNPSRFWKLDAATGSVLDTWDLAGGTPDITYGLCMDSDPNYLWMVVGNTLSKVSIAGKQVVNSYVLPGVSLLQGVAMVSSTTFWLVDGNNKNILEVQLN